jgi:sugar fermentation stimulation protein A
MAVPGVLGYDRPMQLPPLVPGRLVRRYKRFLADVVLDDGREVIAHVANSGSMLGLATPGSRVHLADVAGPTRKLGWSWQLVETAAGALVGIDTGRANALAVEAIRAGLLGDLADYADLRREVPYGAASRVDILLEDPARGRAYVEVKSVTLSRAAGLAEFPDAVTARGTKHLADLAAEVGRGHRAVLLFLVQRPDCDRLTPAADIDPTYALALATARAAGVEIAAIACDVTPAAISPVRPIPVV